jgi:hypothetical protein
MKKKSFCEETPYDVEDDPGLEEEALFEDDEKDQDREPPVGFEDLLYEAWRESQIQSQNNKKVMSSRLL